MRCVWLKSCETDIVDLQVQNRWKERRLIRFGDIFRLFHIEISTNEESNFHLAFGQEYPTHLTLGGSNDFEKVCIFMEIAKYFINHISYKYSMHTILCK